MHALVVRPFGTKEGRDFDAVQELLIGPALTANGVTGASLGEIARSGNIRVDMFQRLLTADLVVADISLHNANVFYELGIRHALRERPTILLRARLDDVPFDLRTDRYVEYDPDDPAAAVEALSRAVAQTLADEKPDSPVFGLLPDLTAPDVEAFTPVPVAFREAAGRAAADGDRALLGVLAREAGTQEWEVGGLRQVGRAQARLAAFHSARRTWERIAHLRLGDAEANLRLGTACQKTGDLDASNRALDRAMAAPALSPPERAEAHALKGSNAKRSWVASWATAGAEARAVRALESGLLQQAFERYRTGFCENLDHYYSGLNALALLCVRCELARAHAETWRALHDPPEAASVELLRLERERSQLAGAVAVSLDAAARRREKDRTHDVWLDISKADHCLLTCDEPGRVRRAYRDAIERMVLERGEAARREFPTATAAAQAGLYVALGVLSDNAPVALDELGIDAELVDPGRETPMPPRRRILVGTGHRVDSRGRATPRFPNTHESLERARQAILEAIEHEKRLARNGLEALAGGASGTDLIFHEECDRAGVPSRMVLPIPVDAYVAASVEDGGPEWVERFRRCRDARERDGRLVVLSDSTELPPWARDVAGYNVFNRGNAWILEEAGSSPSSDVTVIALWNGEAGDGPGGTADMVATARERGAKVARIDSNELFALGDEEG